ncbi:MAG: hypothetical protein AB7P99_16730 [Vicinamibacterales bacterium]
MVKVAAQIALGLGLVLHGLANGVWPLRGIDAVGAGEFWPPITALYVIAILGFVAAGLGVLGVRPLSRAVAPAALVAGVCALGAQFWRADADLWIGVLLSAALPVLATLYTATWPPEELPRRATLAHRLGSLLAVVFLAWVGVSATLWPWHRAWGTTPVEWEMSLPGAATPGDPANEILRAVTIEAPPEVVAQVVRGRAGVLPSEGAVVLYPYEGGRTRLLIRSTISHNRIPAWLAAVNFTAFELPHFIMQRRMMLGIKAQAEQAARG